MAAASLHPGSAITTDIASRGEGVVGAVQAFLFRWVLGWFTKDPDQGAATTLYCCLLPHDELQARYFDNCAPKPPSKLAQGDKGKQAGAALEEASRRLTRSFL